MKKTLTFLTTLALGMFWLSTASAVATPPTSYDFSPTPADIYDLDHYRAYAWEVQPNITGPITGASITFDDIRNWNTGTNDLYISLMNSITGGWRRAGTDVTIFRDYQATPNYFTTGVELAHYHNLSNVAQDLTYDFTAGELVFLNQYLADDGIFFLGFDPDCHFYNHGVTLTLETDAVPIPGALLLLGSGLLGLAGLRSRKKTTS